MPKLLIIDDNPDFGGHQVMAAYGLEGLLRFGDWSIRGLLHPENLKNRQRWEAAREGHEGRFEIEASPTQSAKFQVLRRYIQRGQLEALYTRIEAYAPDVILVIQGNIEQACSIFSLKHRLKAPLVSYIPVPHTHREMGAKLGRLRDMTCAGLYAVPDGFITISNTLGAMLVDYGASGRIQIVENGLPLECFESLPTAGEARKQFGLPETGFIWGQIGRVEFKQKGQDFALALFLERCKQHPQEHLVFLGSGPDSAALEAEAAAHPNVHCLPWTDNPAPLYAALNALLLPSRYEGVPLVMLEALANAVPVLATDRDGMCDWLPREWRFAYRDQAAGLKAMDALQAQGASPAAVHELKAKIWSQHTVAHFQTEFNQALETWR